MNAVLENIHGRRSIRRYLPSPVTDEDLRAVLEAANAAPSAHNRQAWKFVVLRGEAKGRLSSLICEGAGRFPRPLRVLLRMASQIIASAPLVVAILGTCELSAETAGGEGSAEFFRLMEVQSASAAVQNLMLAASSLGLGTVWLGAVCLLRKEITASLSQEGELLAVVPIGYPATSQGRAPRKKNLSEVVVY